MKTKAAKIFSSIKYELCIFVLLAVQALRWIVPNFYVGEYLRVYYLVDLSMAKTSRLLIGSIVKLLNPDPSPEWIAGFATVAVFAVLLFASILIGKVIRFSNEEVKPQLLVFAAFAVTGVFTFTGFSVFLGFLDVWMLLVTLLAVVCACNKYLRWFVPVLCATGVFIHNAYALTYFSLIILVVFYLMVTSEKKAGNAVVFLISGAVTAALTLFVTLRGSETATVTYEQLFEILKNKGGHVYDDRGIESIAYYILNIPPSYTGYTAEFIADASLWESIYYTAKFALQDISLGYTFSNLIFGISVLAAFWAIWIKCIKNTEVKSRKFVYACFMLFSLLIFILMVVAYDFARWFQAGILVQFGLVMFMFFSKDEPFEKTMQELGTFFGNKKLLVMLVFIVYATAQPHGTSA